MILNKVIRIVFKNLLINYLNNILWQGDGGSPLMCPYKDDPDHLVQVGIVAWGINCGLADIPAAYVNVAGFVYWIKNEIEKRGY